MQDIKKSSNLICCPVLTLSGEKDGRLSCFWLFMNGLFYQNLFMDSFFISFKPEDVQAAR
jgi:hypothetical protein